MKLKYPKKVTIGAYEFEMVYDKKTGGGSFELPYKGKHGKITIGTRDANKDPGDFLSILIHELTEVIHVTLAQRFTHADTNYDYLFCYRHQGHTAACNLLAGVLKQFIG